MPFEDIEETGEESTESLTANESTDTGGAEGNAQAQAGASNKQTQAESTAFHEHPRFQELVAQKNQFASQAKQYESQIAQLQRQFAEMQRTSTAQKREDALHTRLKGIDPEFGERFAKVDGSLSQLQELQQWKQQMELNMVRQQAVQMVNGLHGENKVPKEMQDLYNDAIEVAVQRTPNASLKDISDIYKAVHSKFSKLLDATKRTDRESYVTDKRKDASIPTNAKGKATGTKKSGIEWSKNKDEARDQLVQHVLRQSKADKDI